MPRASSSWCETVVGMQTVKSAAVEPLMQAQWEERLAAYVPTALVALNMIANQTVQPILRLSQLWQDFSKCRFQSSGSAISSTCRPSASTR